MVEGDPVSAGPPPVIGIVGGIGSGKSRVASLLEASGCIVSDADALARAALRDETVRDTIVSWWGEGMLEDDGSVSRARVADRVFADPAELDRLEALLHPLVESGRRAEFDAAGDDTTALVIDAPLLLEVGLDRECDVILYVDTPRAVRLERVASSRGWDEAELARREGRQMSLDEKRSRAHHVVVNHGRVEDLREQVEAFLATLGR
ncbi:MAG TPA: dephospho-CoA kinase [Phycisphaerales bacterium]|nr:dephospho-CoA kinase [Phycisphaerales bacterium]